MGMASQIFEPMKLCKTSFIQSSPKNNTFLQSFDRFWSTKKLASLHLHVVQDLLDVGNILPPCRPMYSKSSPSFFLCFWQSLNLHLHHPKCIQKRVYFFLVFLAKVSIYSWPGLLLRPIFLTRLAILLLKSLSTLNRLALMDRKFHQRIVKWVSKSNFFREKWYK